jgi:RNAse (barnase) inhibitor barstar
MFRSSRGLEKLGEIVSVTTSEPEVRRKKPWVKPPQRGRTVGTKNKKTLARQSILDRLTQGQKTPLDIMLDNMMFAHEKAERHLADVVEWLERAPPENADVYQQRALNIVSSFRTALAFRDASQRFAEGAAPYCHPKLSAIAHKIADPNGDRASVEVRFVEATIEAAHQVIEHQEDEE